MSVTLGFLLKNLSIKRSFSTSKALCEFQYYSFRRHLLAKFVDENPNAGKQFISPKYISDSLGTQYGESRVDQILLLMGIDERKRKHLNRYSTKEDPNMIPSHEDSFIHSCVCSPDSEYLCYLKNFKGMPSRCFCGHWFELVDYDRYYDTIDAKREKRYNQLKDKPGIKELEAIMDSNKKKFDELVIKAEDKIGFSQEIYDLKKEMFDSWKLYISAKCTIEDILDLPDQDCPDLSSPPPLVGGVMDFFKEH